MKFWGRNKDKKSRDDKGTGSAQTGSASDPTKPAMDRLTSDSPVQGIDLSGSGSSDSSPGVIERLAAQRRAERRRRAAKERTPAARPDTPSDTGKKDDDT